MNTPVTRQRKARYVVRDSAGDAIRETDSRFIAWWTWFRRRSTGVTAHDRLSWIDDERRWLRCEGNLSAGTVRKHKNDHRI